MGTFLFYLYFFQMDLNQLSSEEKVKVSDDQFVADFRLSFPNIPPNEVVITWYSCVYKWTDVSKLLKTCFYFLTYNNNFYFYFLFRVGCIYVNIMFVLNNWDILEIEQYYLFEKSQL